MISPPSQQTTQNDNLFAIIGEDPETGKERVYYRAQPNNQQKFFDLVFRHAPINDKSYILLGGAVGGGKTKSLVSLAIGMALQWPGTRCYICRKDFSDLRDTLYKDFVSLCPPDLIAYPRASLSDRTEAAHEVKFHNGSIFMFRELKDLGGKFGLEVNLIVIEQVEEIEQEIYQIMDTRLRPWPDAPKDSPYIMALASNPHPGWVKAMFVDNETLPEDQKMPRHHYIPLSPMDNFDLLKIMPNYIKDMERKFPKAWVKRYLLGDWDVAIQGAIHPEFDSRIHVVKNFQIPKHWKRYMCLDPHLAKPFYALWAAQAPGGPLFVYDEMIGTMDQASSDFFHLMMEKERGMGHGLVFHRLIDYSLAGVLHKRNDGKTLRSVIADMGLYFRNAQKTNKWECIMQVKELLNPSQFESPMLYFTDNCKETIWQHKNYRYHDHAQGTDFKEKILKERDDLCDCLQYICSEKPWLVRRVPDASAPSYVGYA